MEWTGWTRDRGDGHGWTDTLFCQKSLSLQLISLMKEAPVYERYLPLISIFYCHFLLYTVNSKF